MDKDLYPERHILSIDLKSFFASCECIARGLDPFKFPLVVANPNQGGGAITLAVTPYLKKQGVKSRGRIYEIPQHIKYKIVPPRTSYYIKMSEAVIDVYLDFVAKEDLHVYSIDECFLDVTDYLKMYKMTDRELAKKILDEVTHRTGLTANCGIGPNILLAKIAMDVEAKLYKDGIAKWTYEDVPNKLWTISPLSKMWGIGPRMEVRLNKLGIRSVGDLAKFDKNRLKVAFGIKGEELWEHANGIDLSRISSFKAVPKDKSYSNSQVLFKDYYGNNVHIIIREMVSIVCKRLRTNNKVGNVIGLAIGFSKNTGGGFYHVIKLDKLTDSEKDVYDTCSIIFDTYYNNQPIRKVGVSVGGLTTKESVQLDLFTSIEDMEKEDNKNKVIDEITSKHGKNSLLKASALLSDSTIKDRNKKIGGHNA
jgi:DNA polymerase V